MSKVLFSVPIKGNQLEDFKREFPQVEFLVEDGEGTRRDGLAEAEVWAAYGFDIKEEDIERAGKLKWIMVYTAGVDALPAKPILERDILVTNVRGIHGPSISEQVFAYLLSHVRLLEELQRQKKKGEWNNRVRPGILFGKTIGIIGAGAIGREIARKAKAFDMKVLGVRKSGAPTQYVDEMVTMEGLHQVLAQSDFVVMALPSTPETRHIMDAKAFHTMKESAYFVNIARGDVVDTHAMVEALREKRIAGAALDVFEEEPLPKDHPLRQMDNVLMTPHTAGLFPGYIYRANDVFQRNLRVYVDGIGEMVNVVDLGRGY